MDGWVRVLRPFNSISVILRRLNDEHERLCAMKRRLGSGRISPPAGFEPATPWTEVGSANRSATRTLLSHLWQSRQSRSAVAELQVFGSPGRDEMRKWTYPYLEMYDEIFQSPCRAEVRKAELQIFLIQIRAEVRKRNFTFLVSRQKLMKCGSGLIHIWKS